MKKLFSIMLNKQTHYDLKLDLQKCLKHNWNNDKVVLHYVKQTNPLSFQTRFPKSVYEFNQIYVKRPTSSLWSLLFHQQRPC